eukprot:g16562.t1
MRRAVELDPDRADAWLFLAETSYQSLAAQQAEVDRRLLSRNLRCVLMTRNIWSQEEPAQHTTCLPRVWDDVLKPELLELLHRSVDDICTWRIKSPRKPALGFRTAAEVAGRLLLQLLGEDEKDYDGIEWWLVQRPLLGKSWRTYHGLGPGHGDGEESSSDPFTGLDIELFIESVAGVWGRLLDCERGGR